MSHYLIIGFVLATFVFSLLYLIRKEKRALILPFFERSNSLIILISIGVIYDFLSGDFIQFKFDNQYEYYTYVNRLYGPNWLLYWCPVIIKGLCPQFFWFKKIRSKMLPAIIMAALLVFDLGLTNYAASHNTYLPSTRVFELNGFELLITFIFYAFFIMGRDINMLWKRKDE